MSSWAKCTRLEKPHNPNCSASIGIERGGESEIRGLRNRGRHMREIRHSAKRTNINTQYPYKTPTQGANREADPPPAVFGTVLSGGKSMARFRREHDHISFIPNRPLARSHAVLRSSIPGVQHLDPRRVPSSQLLIYGKSRVRRIPCSVFFFLSCFGFLTFRTAGLKPCCSLLIV